MYRAQFFILLFVGFLFIAGVLVQAAQQTSELPEQYASQELPLCDLVTTFPEMTAFRLSGLGELSGQPAGATQLGGEWSEPFVGIYNNTPPQEETRFKAGYDEKGLYFLVRCEEPYMATRCILRLNLPFKWESP